MEKNNFKKISYFKDGKVEESNACLPSGMRGISGKWDLEKEEAFICTKEGTEYKLTFDINTDEISLELVLKENHSPNLRHIGTLD